MAYDEVMHRIHSALHVVTDLTVHIIRYHQPHAIRIAANSKYYFMIAAQVQPVVHCLDPG
ncbi:hypothetical protein GPLA_3877 [Paraglaciecola polaris LMG 21857]|uniref:Uncharacterized protein n=1 Tax=Paraglaciecola polaris LMG 21857 TaxID=1129793 RepID=K6ZWY0_9ALTE|nr:hypothetical protein GPLA_3877 [Paraglaciecola polaris LMG 21857]|tara:strand:+ start:623 stop:802 length:180 start_codon:yes stop_codon:yes gene_type:complete